MNILLTGKSFMLNAGYGRRGELGGVSFRNSRRNERNDALKLIRRSGKHWSQDEGLALFLLADSLLPAWQKKVFGKSAVSIIDLLQKSIERNKSRN